MSATDPRYERLPKWAQRRISVLERDLADALGRLSTGPEDSDTFADPYSDCARPLGAGPRIKFVVDAERRRYFHVHIDGEDLRIYGSGGFAVLPQSTNLACVRLV